MSLPTPLAQAAGRKDGAKGDASKGSADKGSAAARENAAGAAAGPGPSSSSGASAGGGDWRLRGPDRSGEDRPKFKPGAVTWDTEDYTTEKGKALAKHAEKMAAVAAGDKGTEAKAKARGGEGPGKGVRMDPKQIYEAAGHVK